MRDSRGSVANEIITAQNTEENNGATEAGGSSRETRGLFPCRGWGELSSCGTCLRTCYWYQSDLGTKRVLGTSSCLDEV